MTEQAAVDTSKVATVEDMRTLTFEAMSASDTKIPSPKQWMELGEKNRVILALGWGSLRHSNTELAKIVQDEELKEGDWRDLYDALCEIEEFYKAVVEDIGVMKARIFIAMCQGFPEETT